MLSRLRSGIGNCCSVVGSAVSNCCGKTLSFARDYIAPPLKFILVADIALETFIGLGARSFFNTANTGNFIASTEGDLSSSSIIVPAIYMGVMTFTLAAMTRTKPTFAQFYPEVKLVTWARQNLLTCTQNQTQTVQQQRTPLMKVRRVAGLTFEYSAKASCLTTMSLTMFLTFASLQTIYEKMASDPTATHDDWRKAFFCWKFMISAIFPYIGWNIIPGFKNANEIGEFFSTGKLSDVDWKVFFKTFGYTIFNLVGSFYIGSYGFQSSYEKISGHKPFIEMCQLAAFVNVYSSIVMMLPPTYKFLKGADPIELPAVTSACLSAATCGKVQNPWEIVQALVYFTGFWDIIVSGFLNSITSVCKTLAKTTKYQEQAIGLILLGCLVGIGSIIMGIAFSIRGGLSRMLPDKEKKSNDLNEQLLPKADTATVEHTVDMNRATRAAIEIGYVPPVVPALSESRGSISPSANFLAPPHFQPTQPRDIPNASEFKIVVIPPSDTPDRTVLVASRVESQRTNTTSDAQRNLSLLALHGTRNHRNRTPTKLNPREELSLSMSI